MAPTGASQVQHHYNPSEYHKVKLAELAVLSMLLLLAKSCVGAIAAALLQVLVGLDISLQICVSHICATADNYGPTLLCTLLASVFDQSASSMLQGSCVHVWLCIKDGVWATVPELYKWDVRR